MVEFGSAKLGQQGQYWDHYSMHGSSLNDEALKTLMIKIEAIVNFKPLTIETNADGTSEAAISLSNLLTMKSKVVMLPPGSF